MSAKPKKKPPAPPVHFAVRDVTDTCDVTLAAVPGGIRVGVRDRGKLEISTALRLREARQLRDELDRMIEAYELRRGGT